MTQKPSRKEVKDNYSKIPYIAVLAATWGATQLGYLPQWISRPAVRIISYTIHLLRDVWK
jgi:hypothetical protein